MFDRDTSAISRICGAPLPTLNTVFRRALWAIRKSLELCRYLLPVWSYVRLNVGAAVGLPTQWTDKFAVGSGVSIWLEGQSSPFPAD